MARSPCETPLVFVFYFFTRYPVVPSQISQETTKKWGQREPAVRHPPVHHEGWMVSGQKTVFCWVSVP